MSERIRVAVVFGGRSGEHPVSCLSAASVLGNLDPQTFEAIAIGITPEGAWRQVDPATVGVVESGRLPQVETGTAVGFLPDPTGSSLVALSDVAHSDVAHSDAALSDAALSDPGITDVVPARALLDVDVVFPVLHGPMGEDGTIQGLLELAGVPYVGPGVLASAAGMDKEFSKKLMAADGLPIGDYVVLRPGDDTVSLPDRHRLGLPVFVKPARAGSSLGVSRVDDWADLDAAIHAARQADPKVLVEAAIIGREIECGVLERPDGTLQVSPAAEIHLAGEHSFYDFDAKYVDDVVTFDIPATLPDAVAQRLSELSLRAFRALDVQGLARVDFFVREAGPDGESLPADEQVLINEINTMPGFTAISMYPRVFQVAGISYPELLETLIRTALARGTGLR